MTASIHRDRYRVDLAAYIDTCDRNYRRLLHLIPALESSRPSRTMAVRAGRTEQQDRRAHQDKPARQDLPGRQGLSGQEGQSRSVVGQVWRFALSGGRYPAHSSAARPAVKVDIRVLESFVYTTTLEIKISSGFPAWAPAPRMQLRLYHDADTAEPLSYQGHRRIPVCSPVPNARMYHEDEKRQINEFLAEWLELCVRFGIRTQSPDTVCIT